MKKPRAQPSRVALERAVADFLHAAGLDLADRHLRDTPKRVAEAWAEELIDGYGKDPASVLGELYPAPQRGGDELVVLTDLHFHAICPHHLLPYSGRAHLAYAPGKWVAGFGRLSALLDCLAHRLVLQEDLARDVARALAEHLESPATACIIEAEQACLRLRGDKQRDAVTHSEAYEGALRKDRQLRRELWARIGAHR
ncbi:MAG: GTP cyclohydrolase I [Myxococcota bacterium]